jgi:predicted DNA-binding ribbon-helix-helix protein
LVTLISKIIVIEKKKTCLRLAEDEWEAIDIICKKENIKRNNLIELINKTKSQQITLTSSIRVFSIIYFYNELIHPKISDNNSIPPPSISEAIYGII